MPKAVSEDGLIQINLRVPPELKELIDKLVAKRRQERPGASVSRADVIREAVYQVARDELAEKPTRKRGARGEAP